MCYRRIHVGVLLAALMTLLFSCAGPRKYVTLAQELARDGKYRAALEMFNKSIGVDTTDEALMGRAFCSMKLRAAPAAVVDYSIVMRHGGKHAARALGYRGVAYARMGHHRKAIDAFTACLKANDPFVNRAEQHYQRAASHLALRQFDAALSDCQRAIDRNGARGDYFELRGDILCRMGDGRGARTNYEKALSRLKTKTQALQARKVRGKLGQACVASAPSAPRHSPQTSSVAPRYNVDAADPMMRLIGEYLLLNPVARQIEVMTTMLLSGHPQWRQNALRRATARIDRGFIENRLVLLIQEKLTYAELQILVEMARLEKSSDPSDASRLAGYRESMYGTNVVAKETSCYNLLQKTFEREAARQCRALGLEC